MELEFEAAQANEPGAAASVTADLDLSDNKTLDGRHYLIVEDNAINSEILCELLQMYGADTTVRIDGEQAVQTFQETEPGNFDAILMDIQMPKMNGYEATRAIRALERSDAGTIPIIAMTANAFAEDIQSALEAGMNAHVAKPIDIKALLATLKKQIRKAAL